MSNFFTDILENDIENSPPISLPTSDNADTDSNDPPNVEISSKTNTPVKRAGELNGFRSIEEIIPKYRHVFNYQYFNFVQSKVIEDALYSDKSMVLCAPTGSGKTVVFEMAIVQLLMEMDNKNCVEDFKIIYMAPIKSLCTERLTEWYPKFTKLNLLCVEVTGDTDVDFSQLKPYRIIITTPEKWDMLTRRWCDNRAMVEVIKLFLIDEVHILNDANRGPVLEAVVSRMKTIQSSIQSAYRIAQLEKHKEGNVIPETDTSAPQIRFVAVSATVSNPEDVAEWLGTCNKPAVHYQFGDECRPVNLNRVVEGYSCPAGTSVFKFDIILNYKLWPLIQKYHNGKPTLIFCNTRKSVVLAAETLSRAITINFNPEQKAKLGAVASAIKNKKIQSLILCGIGYHHAGLLFEERTNIEQAFRNGDLPILITTTTLAMGVNLPAHLVIIKNTQQYVNGAYQEYSISTVLQMVGRAGRPQFDTEATAVIMTRLSNKARYQALVSGCEPLQSYLHKRLAENLNSEAALGTVNDLAQCVEWLRSTFLFVRAARDPKKYLGLAQSAPSHLITKKMEDLCIIAMNSLASSGLITMDQVTCIESTEAGRLLSIYYLDLETMKHIMKINGNETLEQLLWIVCESHELSDMHLRVDERRCLNALNRNNIAATIRFPMKGKITNRQMKLNCLIQAILGCLPIHEPSLNQEAIKVMRIANRICKCIAAYVTRPNMLKDCPQNYEAVLNSIILAKCLEANLWENSIYVSKQLKGIGPTFSALLATAGKLNFMLLEESHPRDLERIMNKGPPAGNVLRKQISLLPKYQLSLHAIDENSAKLHLVLLNQMHLAENIELLTAGAKHKCYIIVGDSLNHLLLLSSFKDKDLINIHDGQMTYNIIRKHKFEHKITAHCISTSFAGIDAHCEYLFRNLEILDTVKKNIGPSDENVRNKQVKQSAITDTFKVRKRNNCDNECLTEKRKRDLPVIKKLKHFNDSFVGSHNKISKDRTKEIITFSNNESRNEAAWGNNDFKKIDNLEQDGSNVYDSIATLQNYKKTKTKDDDLISKILNEIENENFELSGTSSVHVNELNMIKDEKEITKSFFDNKVKNDEPIECKNKKSKISNFNVIIDDTEKKGNLFDESEATIGNEENSFSNTVKISIDQYLEKIKRDANLSSKVVNIINTTNQETSLENLDNSKSYINVMNYGKMKRHTVDTDKYCEDIMNDNTLNVKEFRDTEFIFDNEQKENDGNKELELDVFPTEEKLNNETDFTQNLNNNYSTKELTTNYVSLPSCSEELLLFCDTESSNEKLNYKSKPEPKLKENFMNCSKSVLNDYNYSLPITQANRSNITNAPDVYENEFCFKNSLISKETDETKSMKEWQPKADYNTFTQSLPRKTNICNDFELNVIQGISNIPLNDSTEKLSYTKTHVNYTKNNISDNNYCLIRKVKINIDVFQTLSAKEEDSIARIMNESNENKKEKGYLKTVHNLCEPSAIQLPSTKIHSNLNQDNCNNFFSNINKSSTVDQITTPETPGKINEYTNNSYPIKPVSNRQTTIFKNLIDKYKDIFARKVETLPYQNKEIRSTPYDDTYNVKLDKKRKRQYSITKLPNPVQSSSRVNSQHSYLKIDLNKRDNSEDSNTEVTEHEQNLDDLLNNFDAVQLTKTSPTLDFESSQQKITEQAINSHYELNQTMFNPKTFLESFKEDGIIPPPPQFCEEIDISSKLDTTFSKSEDNSPNYIIHDDNTLDSDEIGVYNHFKKTEITQAKETETWTLTRDDVYAELSQSSVRGRNNFDYNRSRSLATSRKLKLENFKFARKNIFKRCK